MQGSSTSRPSCDALRSTLRLENTTILEVAYIQANSSITTPGSCQSSATVSSPLCRIYAQVNTTESSSLKFEAWLPDLWYGRLITIGSGGLSACIDYNDLDYTTSSFHFAAIASDSGHDGDTAAPLMNEPEVINDFSFQAVHASAELGKQVVQQYYSRSAAKSYYTACSNGGRQGMQAALLYPQDFDGILAGSPAVDFNHLLGWLAILGRDVGAPNGNSSSSFIPDALWPVVSAAIMEQCDLLDGVADQMLTEPDDCFFDPSVLLCPPSVANADSDACLTADQIVSLEKIYSPLINDKGVELWPRYDPLAENTTLRQLTFSGSIFSYPTSWWQNTIYNDTNYSFDKFGIQDIEFADTINPGGIAAFSGNFSAFRQRGGKIVTFHGREDGLIASGNSKRFYDLATSTLSLPNLDDFYRLFLVPGLAHCFYGPGAWKIGQSQLGSGVVVNDSAHNLLLALVDWVEGDTAPGSIIGTGDDGSTREHCRYPRFKSQWNGTAWNCVEI
ncbi:tannase and feruloyl esterase [Stereum hirsutum FP-91666 SS1]|uniref:tannase and feruloyl esterase n=1 Tax=Stereum hirsutum (strain FP-91666) TaxID=721885 RepID=UPI000440A0C7|nr:tannase and feruloyl esterase [Stereum hirsutum FP-91666 SS1]EIM87541.1 tannase and feruloyl esterase [Stereum hirsutum FP-91666 SS1]